MPIMPTLGKSTVMNLRLVRAIKFHTDMDYLAKKQRKENRSALKDCRITKDWGRCRGLRG